MMAGPTHCCMPAKPNMIRFGACHCGLATTAGLTALLPIAAMSRQSHMQVPSQQHYFCSVSFRLELYGRTSTSMRGMTSPDRLARKVAKLTPCERFSPVSDRYRPIRNRINPCHMHASEWEKASHL